MVKLSKELAAAAPAPNHVELHRHEGRGLQFECSSTHGIVVVADKVQHLIEEEVRVHGLVPHPARRVGRDLPGRARDLRRLPRLAYDSDLVTGERSDGVGAEAVVVQ